jgi:flagellar basal-body rod protein FlgF/flagellar basal-body rod protein FlgG
MYYGLYTSAAGAGALNHKVEVLSNNLANVNTVGFKRELAILQARESESIERGLTSRGTGSLNDVGGGVRMNQTFTDFAPGTMQLTQIPTDLAIDSKNTFFMVDHDGQKVLTRAGNFHISNEGKLVTASGDPVLSSDGSEIQVDPSLPFRFVPGGVLEQAGDRTELALIKPKDVSRLQKAGENYFQLEKQSEMTPADDRNVKIGYLEMSGVNPVDEMVELITASRAYEANVRIIQQHDTATSELISRMLKV